MANRCSDTYVGYVVSRVVIPRFWPISAMVEAPGVVAAAWPYSCNKVRLESPAGTALGQSTFPIIVCEPTGRLWGA